MNENRQVLEHLEKLVGFPMSLLIYIERVVELQIFSCVGQFTHLTKEEIQELEKIAMPGSVTKAFCKSLMSFDKGESYSDFLMKDVDDVFDDDEEEDLFDENKVEILGMALPDLSSEDRIPETSYDKCEYFYKLNNGSILYVGGYVEIKSLASFVVFEEVKNRLHNVHTMTVQQLSEFYKAVATTANLLDLDVDVRSEDFIQIGETIIDAIEQKSKIPYK